MTTSPTALAEKKRTGGSVGYKRCAYCGRKMIVTGGVQDGDGWTELICENEKCKPIS